MIILKRVCIFGLFGIMAASMCSCALWKTADYDFSVSYDGIKKGSVSSGTAVHDPSVLSADGMYYIYGSHMTAAKSPDLVSWSWLAEGYAPENPVYGQIYSVRERAFAYAGDRISAIPTDDGGTHVWAPDVIYNKTDGLYYMYYCTTSTWNASNICCGVSSSPEGPFVWQGALIYSGFDMSNITKTDVLDYVSEDYAESHYIRRREYNFNDCPNAIDPTVFYDKDGRMWMVYGSWSGGIFLIEIDPHTGGCIRLPADEKNDIDPYFGKRLLGGGHKSIEGPYIIWDESAGYYYLFVSYGGLTSSGGYQIRVFRSKTVDGDYEDMNGRRPAKGLNHAYYGLKLSGNYRLPGNMRAYMATGHNSALIDKDGKKYIVYHTRFEKAGETHSPRAHQFIINEEGWPCMLPYQTQGETVSETGYPEGEVAGRYYVINQGTEINKEIAEPVILYLEKNGRVIGEKISGTWKLAKNSCYVAITLDGQEYSGVFCRMPDEAGTDVMTFSAVGGNASLWGVMYGTSEPQA
ncbi:MAG: glycoside hydrolase family 43 protein [Oscillospiraceae bacterium]|jgi:arabinan endo-1,5-alpha-L-arabinosidase|nr:glycoside hydrolase family 43 protein [Oscillospiraceae bacterium]